MDLEAVGKEIVDAAVKVHRALGPGLLESAYQRCLTYELRKRGLHVDCEVLFLCVLRVFAVKKAFTAMTQRAQRV
jgi:GxxExxY protein